MNAALTPAPLYPHLTLNDEAQLAPDRLAVLAEAGAVLAERRRVGRRGPLLPDAMRPRTHAEALAVQAAVARLLGWPVAGWKCALPAPGKLVVAPIYAPTVCRAEAEGPRSAAPVATAWPWVGDGAPAVRVEPELAFVLATDLPPRAETWSPAEVDSAVEATHLALELIDSRYAADAAPSFEDKLADGLVNQGLFVGPRVDGEAARKAVRFPITIQMPGQPDAVRDGVMPDGLPRGPLHWLAEFLRQQGTGLRAGQVVITGSYAGAFDLPCGVPVQLRYGTLGTLSVCLHARTGGLD